MPFELYEVLGVPPTATREEIHRAYFRMTRIYSPEKDPTRFNVIREAHDTLYDEKSRRKYDANQHYGEEIDQLLDEASRLKEQEKWREADGLFKKVLEMNPELDDVLFQRACCFIQAERWDQAIKYLVILTNRVIDNALYYITLGHAYCEKAATFDNDSYKEYKESLLDIARQAFQQAITLQSYNSHPYELIARSYVAQSDYCKAEEWIEKALYADGKLDFNDFDSLFYLAEIYVLSEQYNKIEQVASRLEPLVPPDEEIRQYVSHRFSIMGYKLFKLKLFEPALAYFKAAHRIDPSDESISKPLEFLQCAVQAINQYEDLEKDSSVIPPLKTLCACYHSDSLDDSENTDSEKEHIYGNIYDEMFQFSIHDVQQSFQRIRKQYPAFYQLNAEGFESLKKEVDRLKSKVNQLTAEYSEICKNRDIIFPIKTLCWVWLMDAIGWGIGNSWKRNNHYRDLSIGLNSSTPISILSSIRILRSKHHCFSQVRHKEMSEIESLARQSLIANSWFRKPRFWGTINIVYGALSIAMAAFGMIMSRVQRAGADEASREMARISKEVMDMPQMQYYMWPMLVIGLAMAICLILAGLKLWKGDILGRTLSLAYAGAALVITTIGMIYNLIVINPIMRQLIEASSMPDQAKGVITTMSSVQQIGISICCSYLYPVLLLIIMLPKKFAYFFDRFSK